MRLLWGLVVVAALFTSGCSEVPYHEKREVSRGKLGHSATGVFVLGADEGMTLVEKLEGVHALIVAADGSLHLSPGLRK